MKKNLFLDLTPSISGNTLLRTPQRGTFAALVEFGNATSTEREVGIVLPVGCGKSGCITLAPFALKSLRTLVIAPGLQIADQLRDDFDPTHAQFFYKRCKVLSKPPYPEPVEIRGKTTNLADLEEAHVVITNIQQLQGDENSWLNGQRKDFFDLIIFDEGHHSVAATYDALKQRFPKARIINFSATPVRADGQIMPGRIVYSFPIFKAIQEGYVKRLKALVLNPKTLKFVRAKDGKEVEVTLEEVRKLGEDDSQFRRSIVTSTETLNTIVDASIRELQRIRQETSDDKHKIIASALNLQHCQQICEAYKSRGLSAEYVHSLQDGAANKKIFKKLKDHELDVIVQVRKLGEGFDHKYLSVAAVFSIFSSLSPFVQFVGRIMRVIKQDAPGHILNQGTVVFHAGANVAQRWEDFQNFSEADQDFFDQLLPIESLDFTTSKELEIEPHPHIPGIDVKEQSHVTVEEIPLLEDGEAMKAIKLLQSRGFTPEQVKAAMEVVLDPVPTTKAKERQAKRDALDQRVKTEAGRILGERNLNPKGKELDKKHLGKENFVVVKSAIDRQVCKAVGKTPGRRHEYTRPELDKIEIEFEQLVESALAEVFDGA